MPPICSLKEKGTGQLRGETDSRTPSFTKGKPALEMESSSWTRKRIPRLATQGTWVGSLVGEVRSHMPEARLSPCATTTELARLNWSPRAANYRAHALWNPRATAREEKTRTPQLERSPRATMKDLACLSENPACHN